MMTVPQSRLPQNIGKRLTVQVVHSQLERGCIFSGEDDAGKVYRVKFSGGDFAPEPGDVFDVVGLLRQYRDRFRGMVEQIDSSKLTRVAAFGVLLGPFLRRLPNIKAKRADRLTEHFGAELLAVLSDVSRSHEVALVLEPSKPGLSARLALQIYAAVAVTAGANELRLAEVEFLAELESLGLRDNRVAGRAWRFMAGLDAVQRLHRNPYLLATMLPWGEADKLGRRVLERSGECVDVRRHPARLCGAVQSVWRDVLAAGHTAVTPEEMRATLEALKIPADEAMKLAAEKRLVRPSGGLLRAPGSAWLEDQVAAAIWAMETREPSLAVPTDQIDRVRVTFDAECVAGLTLESDQQEAVAELLALPVAGLQGGAGVGKTTVMKVLAEAWERLGGNIVLGAVAGKAALQLARGASSAARPRVAFSVARLIGMLERRKARAERPELKVPASDVEFNESTQLIIDEAGMLDTPSLHRLLSLLPDGARVLFAGDVGQLPPVGPGAFFRDLVTEGSRVVTLTKVRRQAEGSVIPEIAGQIREGVVPQLQSWEGEDDGVYLVSPERLLEFSRRLRRSRETLVVAALRKTVSFVNNSEAAARRVSGVAEVRAAPDVYVSVGDPVVMNSNRYAEGLYNGLLGVVTGIAEAITVQWDGNPEPTEVSQEAAADLDLAYAITCHKAQGSAADAVLIAVEKAGMVTREWLYTAVTRGRRLVLLAADEGSIGEAVSRRTFRCTGMQIGARPNG
ncbi:MAG: ATP-dependent RecD-like DNA helicase [Rubrivivax sp.]|nr:ATP-dependent RecD-like DNA helicase [Rubrivivax sp.]